MFSAQAGANVDNTVSYIRRRICEIIVGWFHITELHFSAAEVFVDSWLTRARFLVGLVQFLNLMPYMG